MIPYEIHPFIFGINREILRTWTILVMLGWLFAWYYVYKSAKRSKDVSVDNAMQLILFIVIGSMVGSRLFHFFGPYRYGSFAERLGMFFSASPGYVAYGGIIGGILTAYIYAKIKNIDFLKYADLIAPGIPLGLFIGRFACFISGDDFGIPTGLPWAINFNGNLLHPVQLYHALANLAVFVIALEIYRRDRIRKAYSGHVFFSTIILYALGRFITEFYRFYSSYYYGLTFSQIVSIALIAIFATLMLLRRKNAEAGKNAKIDKNTKKAYSLMISGGLLSIISALFINASFYLLLLPMILGWLVLFLGIRAYASGRGAQY